MDMKILSIEKSLIRLSFELDFLYVSKMIGIGYGQFVHGHWTISFVYKLCISSNIEKTSFFTVVVLAFYLKVKINLKAGANWQWN